MSYMQNIVRRQQTLTNWLAQAEKSGKITDSVYDIGEFLRPAAALVVLRQVVAKSGQSSFLASILISVGKIELDKLGICFDWKSADKSSVFLKIKGLKIQGCRFDGSKMLDNEPTDSDLSDCPVTYVTWKKVEVKSPFVLIRI
jgi:dynein heavy chain 2